MWEKELDKGFNFDKPHLRSEVITDKEKENLKKILSEEIDENLINDKNIKNNRSPYVQNYNYFRQQIKNFKSNTALDWGEFCRFVVYDKNLFVLFVLCDSQDSAVTIFNTLNSRGMPLSNADILKGYLYKHHQKQGDTDSFIKQWSDIEKNIENNEGSKKVPDLDFLFLQYMHIIKAYNKNFDARTPGLLDFFTKTSKDNKKSYKSGWKYKPEEMLYERETMPFITLLTNFWLNPQDYLQDKSLYYMNILFLYQNSAWKSFASCLVWKNRELMHGEGEDIDKQVISNAFEAPLLEFLKKVSLLLINNQASMDKTDAIVAKLNVNLLNDEISSSSGIEKISYPDEENFFDELKVASPMRIKYLLYLYAYIYDNFSNLIDDASNLQIEHILPKQWQNACFDGWDEDSHKEYLEKIGNKILLEKKTNIKCANNFFAKKKEKYAAESKLKEVKDLATKEDKNAWLQTDIDKRSKEIYNKLKNFVMSQNPALAR